MITALLVIDALVVLLWVFSCASFPFVARQMPRARTDAPAPTLAPRLSVIIPARDEEMLLPRCLASVRGQDVPVHELILVDDDSNDATARVAIEGCARTVLCEAERQGVDLLSLLPRQTCSTFLEAEGQPVFMLASMGSLDIRNVNDAKSPAAAAWGGFLLFPRASYDTIGGFAAVQN